MFISKISDNVPSVISKVPFNFDFLNNKNTGTEQLNISKSNVKIPVEQNSNAKRAVEQNSNTNKTLEPNSTVKKTVEPSTNTNKAVESNSKVNKTVETKKTELEKQLSSTSKTTVKKDTFNKTKVVDINSAPVIQPKDKSPVPSLKENVDPNQLHTVYFDFGVYTLSEEETLELNKIIQKINLNDNSKIELIGHTDCIGQEDENLLLSSLRLKSVEKFLIKNGVKAARINSVIAKGEKEPVADNNRSKGRAKNRRVEIIMR
jgi:outer membrane protein OmpA-like peptidoglycan-associated protein